MATGYIIREDVFHSIPPHVALIQNSGRIGPERCAVWHRNRRVNRLLDYVLRPPL
jgi:hypothetical protein